jgi:hypothetical protein
MREWIPSHDDDQKFSNAYAYRLTPQTRADIAAAIRVGCAGGSAYDAGSLVSASDCGAYESASASAGAISEDTSETYLIV